MSSSGKPIHLGVRSDLPPAHEGTNRTTVEGLREPDRGLHELTE
jgi:hypothetical protein